MLVTSPDMTPFAQRSRLFTPACSLALLLLLAACGGDEPIWNLTMRARHGDAWRDFTESPGSHFITEEGAGSAGLREMSVCGFHGVTDADADGTYQSCMELRFDFTALGADRSALTIAGTAIPLAYGADGTAEFTAQVGHAPAIVSAWAWTVCDEMPRYIEQTPQQLRGELVLDDPPKLKGRLSLRADVRSEGPCQGDVTELELVFDLDR
ncbi:hypothetical protein MVI01_19560 [Myxococcus virescens]|uniref:Uncharacterized protein n=2 Tax=Myxococcus virescens TaxID=83456 RepID=A0A511H9G9_9BACT|nr:hypothetical protein MVI01_19560 [Myxococcus virescens]SDD78613.1 hypothetical protein SAMN04488504_102694 [Myxococcus virescens]